MLRVLRQRDFSILWFAGFISLLGDWMLAVAVPVAVYELTDSAMATGGILIVRQLPRVFLGSIAGVFVDRWSMQRTMIVANLVRAPLLFVLLLVNSPDEIWILYGVMFAFAIATQFFGPAEDSLLPQLVGKEDLVVANALNGLNNNLSRLIGPAVGGIIAAWWGLSGAALIDSATFVIAAGMIAMINAPGRVHRVAPGANDSLHAVAAVWHEWLDGLHAIRTSSGLRVIFGVIALASLGEGVMGTAFWIYVDEALHGGAKEAGWLMAAQGIGGLTGSVVIGAWARALSPVRLIGWGAIGLGLIDLITFNYPALLPALWPGLVTMAIVGIPASAFMAGYMSSIQRDSSETHRGRIFGAINTTSAALAIIGAVIAGLVTGPLGAVPTLTVQSAAYVAAGILALMLLVSPAVDQLSRSAAPVAPAAD